MHEAQNEPDRMSDDLSRLSDDTLDDHLLRWALAAQKYPKKSKQRRQILNQMIGAIYRSRRLTHPRKNLDPQVYQDLYSEALQNLGLYISQNIERYDPERAPVMRWVNYLLARRFFHEAYLRWLKQPKQLFEFIEPPAENDCDSLSMRIRQCLEEDVQGVFKKHHIRGKSSINFQSIAILRLDGYQWNELAEEFDINLTTLSDMYQRGIKKFTPIIKVWVQDQAI
jgi:hypothetical protein